jgi:hypothetical protein
MLSFANTLSETKTVWDKLELSSVPTFTVEQYVPDGGSFMCLFFLLDFFLALFFALLPLGSEITPFYPLDTPMYDVLAATMTSLLSTVNVYLVIVTDGEDSGSTTYRFGETSDTKDERKRIELVTEKFRAEHRERHGPMAICEFDCYFIGATHKYADIMRTLGCKVLFSCVGWLPSRYYSFFLAVSCMSVGCLVNVSIESLVVFCMLLCALITSLNRCGVVAGVVFMFD